MRAYIAIGPPSSGNRYVASLLRAAGCTDAGEDICNPFRGAALLAAHRSLPHGNVWPTLADIAQPFFSCGYSVTLLPIFRDGWSMRQSCVASGHTASAELADSTIRRAYEQIFRGLPPWTDVFPVCYSSLGRPRYVAWLLRQLNLNAAGPLPFFQDGDHKHHWQTWQEPND